MPCYRFPFAVRVGCEYRLRACGRGAFQRLYKIGFASYLYIFRFKTMFDVYREAPLGKIEYMSGACKDFIFCAKYFFKPAVLLCPDLLFLAAAAFWGELFFVLSTLFFTEEALEEADAFTEEDLFCFGVSEACFLFCALFSALFILVFAPSFSAVFLAGICGAPLFYSLHFVL